MTAKEGSGPRAAAHGAKRCFLNSLETSSKLGLCPPFIGHLPACLSSLGGPCRSTKTPWQRRTDRARAFETSAYVFLRSPRHVVTSNKNYAPQEINRNELQTLELASPAATCSQHQHTVAAKDLATTFLLGRAPPAVCWGRRIYICFVIPIQWLKHIGRCLVPR